MILTKELLGYILQKPLGDGGFGKVYLAYQKALNRYVAIKVVKPEFANDAHFIRRFEEEAKFIARLEHDHIIPVYDSWRDADGAYIVMRFLNGGSVDDMLAKRSKQALNDEEVFRIASQIGAALQYSHDNHIIHRDLKPANILYDSETKRYVLTDFGIARVEGKLGTGSGVEGTLHYMPPEQIEERIPQHTLDIYSFGVVLYELLTGKLPFEGTMMQLISKIREAPFPNLNQLRPDLSPNLNTVLQKACAKAPSERYQNMRDFIEEFSVALQGKAVVQSPRFIKPRNPYKGLSAFEQDDASDYYGRTALVDKLMNRLKQRSVYQHFLAIVGASGSGKSSLIRAGLTPALRKDENSAGWYIVPFVPGTHPLRKLEAALLSIAVDKPADLESQLSTNELSLAPVTSQILGEARGDLLLLIDHFEELFTLAENEAEVSQFLSLLYHAVCAENSRLWIVVAIRADFYDSLLAYKNFAQLLQERTQLVLEMDAQELTEAIVRPVKNLGMSIEPDLLTALISDINKQSGALPLLQYSLSGIFEATKDKVLQLQSYQNMGGITGALSQGANAIYEALPAHEQLLTQEIFISLAQFNEDEQVTRRRVKRRKLREDLGKEVDALLEKFVYHDLLSFDVELGSREPTVEVAHEAIFRSWQALEEWLEKNRQALPHKHELEKAAEAWQKSNHDEDDLLKGVKLSSYEDWIENPPIKINEILKGFIQSSIAKRQQTLNDKLKAAEEYARAKRISNWRLRIAVLILSLLMLVALLSLQVVSQASKLAQASSLAQEAQSAFNQANNDIALDLALDSADINRDIAMSILTDVAYSPGTNRVFTAFEHGIRAFDLSSASSVTLLAEGQNLWRLQLGNRADDARRLIGRHEYDITALAISRDEQIIYSADMGEPSQNIGGKLRVWDSNTGQLLREFDTGIRLRSIDISPDGQRLLLGGGEPDYPDSHYALQLWDLSSYSQICTFNGHTQPVNKVLFIPGTNFALSGSGSAIRATGDNSLRLWDISGCVEVPRFSQLHTDLIQDMDYIPANPETGTQASLLTASGDHTLILWDFDSGAVLQRFGGEGSRGHSDWVNAVAFHPNGRWILSGGWDNQLILWDIHSGELIQRFIGHGGPINDLRFDENDPNYAYSIADDGEMRRWRITNALIENRFNMPANNTMTRVQQSPDQRWIASASAEGVLTLWNRETGEKAWEVPNAHSDWIYALAFSPDSRYLVSGGADRNLIIWDVASHEAVFRNNSSHLGRIWTLDFSLSGTYLASGSDEGNGASVYIWEFVQTGANPVLVEVQSFDNLYDIYAVDFSPDEQYLLAGGLDKNLYYLDRVTGSVGILPGHTASVNDIDFSPSAAYAVSGGYDNTLIVWDVAQQKEIARLLGHFGPIWDIDFSENERIMSGSADGTIRIWDWRNERETGRISYNTPMINMHLALDLQRIAICSQGAIEILGLPEDNLEDLESWIYQNRYRPED